MKIKYKLSLLPVIDTNPPLHNLPSISLDTSDTLPALNFMQRQGVDGCPPTHTFVQAAHKESRLEQRKRDLTHLYKSHCNPSHFNDPSGRTREP